MTAMHTPTPAKITLVRPPSLQLGMSLSVNGSILPIGLAYVAAVLRDAGHELAVIDAPGEALDRFIEVESPIGKLLANGLTADEIIDRLDIQTEILAITHMFLHEWPTIREIAEKAKAKVPGLVVILGGENSTAFWKTILEETDVIDYCVLGEGEATIVELVARLQANLPVDDLPGVASRSSTNHPSNQLAERMTQVDSIPRPAWELFPVERYMQTADNYGVHRGRSIPMLATRGCPYRCTFCSSPSMWTTRYITREPQEVVDEIKDYVERYRIDNVDFCDLTAIINRKWTLEFCRLLEQANLGIAWQLPVGTRSEALDKEVLEACYRTGCRNITYAPESGSQRVLDTIKKRVKIPKLLESLRAACRIGLVTRVNYIIGHPCEQRLDLWKTFWLLMKTAVLGCHDTAIMIFAPYPGSEDTNRLLEEGKLTVSEEYYYVGLARTGLTCKTYNPAMSTRELIAMQHLMTFTFYATAYLIRPWRFLSVVCSLLTGKERTQLDQFIRTKRRQFVNSHKWLARLLPRRKPRAPALQLPVIQPVASHSHRSASVSQDHSPASR